MTIIDRIHSEVTQTTTWKQYRDLLIDVLTDAGYSGHANIILSKYTPDLHYYPKGIIALIAEATGYVNDRLNAGLTSLDAGDPLFYREVLGRIAGETFIYPIWTEGDSLMNGAYGYATKTGISQLLWNLSCVNTAVGGSTIDDQAGRVISNTSYQPRTLIWWDGSFNGLRTIDDYLNRMAFAIKKLGHDRFVIIPPINPRGSTWAGSTGEELALRMRERWPNNFLHWNLHLINTDNAIADSEWAFTDGSDNYHISELGVAHMSLGIVEFLNAKGWVSIEAVDPILAEGSVWLMDMGLSPFATAPVTDSAVFANNIAWEKARALIGSGDATTLGSAADVVITNSGADVIVELTEKKGLHVITSQDSAFVGGSRQGVLLAPRALIQQYVDDHVADDWFFSTWFIITRTALVNPPGGDPATNSAKQSPFNKAQNTGNYLFFFQDLDDQPSTGSNYLGSLLLPDERYSDVTLDAAQLRNIGTTGYTGTKPALGNGTGQGAGVEDSTFGLHMCLGSFDAWSYFNNGAAPSIIGYRAYAENLTVTGRTYAQASAIDRLLFKDAFGSGGRFYDDSYTDPATLP